MTEFERDVIVVGGGLSGCVAARSLTSLGFRVAVVDRVGEARDEFRAEQLVGPQIEQLRSLGLLAPMVGDAAPTATTINARRGAILDRATVAQYGLSYRSMVAGGRAALSLDDFVVAMAVAIDTSATQQIVRLADGRALRARLVVVATGLLPHLPKALNIETRMISPAHSLCLGFDLALHDPRGTRLLLLIYYGEAIADRMDYLALFQMGAAVRANLFCYHARDSDWGRRFVARPDDGLAAALPGLAKLTGRWSVASRVEARNNDIRVATNVVRDGVVLIGDAFQTPCPSAGTGVDRILSDARALVRHVPSWLAAGDVGAARIAAFYDDPEKRACDAQCLHIARYRRAVSTEMSLAWRAHRLRTVAQRRLKAAVQRFAAWPRSWEPQPRDPGEAGDLAAAKMPLR